ncbi:MAG: carboxymuconolactone decarboxylase family protein [Deltaproteobacteria bacterium]|nr:carboxymuconolactone decarboxylase family protein [Deltaproteobacteria bacterium]
MRLDKPRVTLLPESEWTESARDTIEPTRGMAGRPVLNIFSTLAHHPELLKRWMVFANHVLMKSTLPPREREILILRIGWLCRAEYEWSQHVLIGKAAGLTEAEIDRIAAGPDAPGWSDDDTALIRATDELHRDAFIGDATWAVLAKKWSVQQLMDVVFAVGQYNLVSMALNTLGVQLDEGLPRAKGMK